MPFLTQPVPFIWPSDLQLGIYRLIVHLAQGHLNMLTAWVRDETQPCGQWMTALPPKSTHLLHQFKNKSQFSQNH